MPPRAARAASPAEGEANKRACDVCHNMKVRCIKQANSCKRCLGLGVACTFAREVPVLRTDRERITALETQMSSIHGLLQNMNTLLVQTAQQTTEIAARAKERPTLGEWVTAVSTALPAQAPLGPPDAASPDSLPRGEEREDEYDLDSSEDHTDGEEEEAEAEEGEEDEDDEDDEDERLETKDNVAETPSFAPLAEERRVPLRSLLQDEAVLRLRKDGAEGSRKRRRLSSHDAGVADARELAETEEDQDPDDPISLGIVSEPEARHLFDLYFAGSSAYLPAFDPAVDTFDAVRSSSALCFSSILMIGQMAADGEARDASPETRTRLKEHAEKLAMRTLFSPVASLRVVQALILLASWGDTAWRPGNHALAIAVDMGLYRCLPHLVDTGMGKSITDAERERGYVAGARVWLALTKLTLEMTLNHGRPFLLPNDEPVEYSRRLLDHPYSIPTDSRVIAACELMLHRTSQIQPFANNTYIPSRVDVILAEGHATFDEWERFWTGYYRQKGVESSDFLVSELAVQKCHSTLHFNYHVLHGVRSRADVACLPDSRRKWLVRCLEVADSLVERMAKDEELSRLRFANHYAFVALAFAAMYLVRLARILPGADLERIQHNVVVLADKLDQFPGFNFCKLLHSVVRGRKRTQGDKAAATPAEGSTDALRDEGSAADLGFINIGDVGDVGDIGGLGDLGDLGDLGLSMGMPTAMQDESWLDLLVDGGS